MPIKRHVKPKEIVPLAIYVTIIAVVVFVVSLLFPIFI